jgi:hypothetical protein
VRERVELFRAGDLSTAAPVVDDHYHHRHDHVH